MAEWIKVVFGTDSTFGLSYIVLEKNSGIPKNKDLFLWSQTLNLPIFCCLLAMEHGLSKCHQLSLTMTVPSISH